MAFQVLVGLAAAGAQIDAYIATSAPIAVADELTAAGVRVVEERSGWQWNKWYSRNAVLALATGQTARLNSQRALAAQLRANHVVEPYDVVYQFSQIESPWSGRASREMPPLVIHPEVHAAGELRWHLRERALARSCEGLVRRLAVRAWFLARATLQRAQVRRADAFVCPSNRFAALLAGDYHIPRERCHVVPNPIDLVRFAPAAQSRRANPTPIEILFVSRISVRKGVDAVVDLSHRLADLAGTVRLTVVGGHSLFSDYRPLLDDLNKEVATYLGPAPGLALPDLYARSDMLIQPSRYEPFALTVAEALASGLPVVASDEVGAAERVDSRVCRVYPAGDGDRLEFEVRRLIDEIRAGKRASLGSVARSEAERLFSVDDIADELLGVLRRVATTTSRGDRAEVVRTIGGLPSIAALARRLRGNGGLRRWR
jgi:glycosyltransferase involved in cell wall biosynthesis